jgi:hypothetical protein
MRRLVRRATNGQRYTAPNPLMNRPAEDLHAPCEGELRPPPRPYRPQEGRHKGRAKLTDDDVRAIRADYATGKWTYRDLAYVYGVGVAAIGGIVRGKSYTQVEGESHTAPMEQEDDT